jgi:hypothetical protein
VFRKMAFKSAFVKCKSKAGSDGINLGKNLSRVTDDQILNLSEAQNFGESITNNSEVTTWLHTIKATCKKVFLTVMKLLQSAVG